VPNPRSSAARHTTLQERGMIPLPGKMAVDGREHIPGSRLVKLDLQPGTMARIDQGRPDVCER